MTKNNNSGCLPKFLDNLRELLTRKVEIQDPSKVRLFLMGTILVLVALIFFLNTADFSKINRQQFSMQNNLPPPPPPLNGMSPPPPPPPELLNLGTTYGK